MYHVDMPGLYHCHARPGSFLQIKTQSSQQTGHLSPSQVLGYRCPEETFHRLALPAVHVGLTCCVSQCLCLGRNPSQARDLGWKFNMVRQRASDWTLFQLRRVWPQPVFSTSECEESSVKPFRYRCRDAKVCRPRCRVGSGWWQRTRVQWIAAQSAPFLRPVGSVGLRPPVGQPSHIN